MIRDTYIFSEICAIYNEIGYILRSIISQIYALLNLHCSLQIIQNTLTKNISLKQNTTTKSTLQKALYLELELREKKVKTS